MKKTLKRLSPDSHKIKTHKHLQWLGRYLHITALWAFNRRTLSRAFAVGLFYAFIPVPFQMPLVAVTAVIFSANLPLALSLVWVTNPVTMPVIFYACYQLGAWILGAKIAQDFQFSFAYLSEVLPLIWQPFLLGCLIVAIFFALLGYWLVRLLFWISLSRYKKKKKSA